MKSWYEIYSERMNDQYRLHLTTKYAPFLAQLHEANRRVTTEIGCGAGNITRILREMQSDRRWYSLIDNCPKMLSLAIENNPSPNCNFTCADILKQIPADSDLIHSHGVLEHFSDLQIQKIVSNLFFATDRQIHYVPSSKYSTPSRGDERLLTPDQWKKILKGEGEVSVTTFNDDLDIILEITR
jgi:SAM-dependent methyltransferase